VCTPEVSDVRATLEPEALVSMPAEMPIPAALIAETRPFRFWSAAGSELRLKTVGAADPMAIERDPVSVSVTPVAV
jgi:hypothetical protein